MFKSMETNEKTLLKQYVTPDGSIDGRGIPGPFIIWRLGEKTIDIEGDIPVEDLIEILLHIAEKEGINLYLS